MRFFALLVGLSGAGCLGFALWLMAKTRDFFLSADYAPNSSSMPGYSAGNVEADGSGIFAPSILLILVAVFLLKFALNLWRKP
jgi:hypothetical protein